MQELPIIPPRPLNAWREFRFRVLPVIVFSITIFHIAQLWSVRIPHDLGTSASSVAGVSAVRTNLLAKRLGLNPHL